jgi:hypothetical protein
MLPKIAVFNNACFLPKGGEYMLFSRKMAAKVSTAQILYRPMNGWDQIHVAMTNGKYQTLTGLLVRS